MSVLSIVQDHCRLHTLNVPSSVVGNAESGVIQFLAIIREIIQELVTESKFNATTQEATFVATGAADQGAMATLAPNGYQWAIFESFYDRTLRRPLAGPLDEQEWQELQALPSSGTWFKYRIRQNHLLLNPAPASPFSTIAFEYISSWAVTSSLGVLKSDITDDADLFVFPENIVRKGLLFRWKQIKGLPYQADETQYYNLLNKYVARDKVKRRIDVSTSDDVDLRPGIFIRSNSWLV